MIHHNKPTVFRGKHGRGWFWACPTSSSNCHAEAFDTHGSSNHWEIALYQAMEHVREFHQVVRHIPHDSQCPPGVYHLDDGDVTLNLHVVSA